LLEVAHEPDHSSQTDQFRIILESPCLATCLDGNEIWDRQGISNGKQLDFEFPDLPDLRLAQFKFRSFSAADQTTVWEADGFR
jgi:hypothetical protein